MQSDDVLKTLLQVQSIHGHFVFPNVIIPLSNVHHSFSKLDNILKEKKT
jgi:hypothetical protein